MNAKLTYKKRSQTVHHQNGRSETSELEQRGKKMKNMKTIVNQEISPGNKENQGNMGNNKATNSQDDQQRLHSNCTPY